MKKFYIKTFGCKTNTIEGQIIAQNLIKSGFEQVVSIKNADILIINSCAVTSHSEDNAFRLIKQARLENPNIKTALVGCVAQTAKNIEGADLILGNTEKLNIDKFIKELFEKEGTKIHSEDIFKVKEFQNKFLFNSTSTRPSVKIQDGCNNRCAYCLIPFARGNSRSNSIENIIEQIKIHIKNNKKEIVLTGIHIGQWGLDFGKNIIDLLVEIEKTDILRYRLGSLYVNEINDNLFNFLKSSKKFCPHFHLSLQSLCDKTLQNMNRTYTKSEALLKIDAIHKSFDLPFIGCDIITGFPNESDDDFMETRQALIDAKVSYIHAFPYSKRKGTAAYSMKNQVLEHVKKERTKELISVCEKLHQSFLDKNKSKTRTILFEKIDKNGLYPGVSENYIKVYKKSDKNLHNTVQTLNMSEFEKLY